MPRIRQLPPHVVAKIAAGEVIERPASVVKELVENSLDAGATRIDIDLEQGGSELVRVADDGCGVAASDMELAFSSHATSKLESADDLFRISTMGFRGEALASIGGVAKVLFQSRPQGQAEGAELACDGGEFSAVRPWNGSPGTRVEVRHLFFNVPVRKKFLKGIPTELGHASEMVTRLALGNPGLHLTLHHNGRLVYDVPASAGLTDRIALFFGGDVRDALYHIDTGPGPVRLTGFAADPACDRGNAKLQYLFVNGRWFRDRSLGHAFQEAYRGLLMTGRYAVGFLFLTVPPDQVDVNVHPTKAEVRFRDSSLMYSLVRAAVKSRLLKENLIPRLEVPAAAGFAAPAAPPAEPERVRYSASGSPEPAGVGQSAPEPFAPIRRDRQESLPVSEGTPFRVPATPVEAAPPIEQGWPVEAEIPKGEPLLELPPAGSALQVHDAYLVLETPRGILVIDQHALHERILYEQLRRRIREGKLEVQRLLIPEPIDLPADQAAIVLEAAPALAELGLEVGDFGGNTILLSSYPTLLARRPPHEILAAVVDHLVTKDRPPTREVLLDHLLATIACKAAVKAGDRLTAEEIAHLLRLREMAEDSHHCPHGRPTSLLFSRQDLDRQFRRT
jgi:DNA mismatch repair protein MutL